MSAGCLLGLALWFAASLPVGLWLGRMIAGGPEARDEH